MSSALSLAEVLGEGRQKVGQMLALAIVLLALCLLLVVLKRASRLAPHTTSILA